MITASVVLYKTNSELVYRILECTLRTQIFKIYIVDNSPVPIYNTLIESFKDARLIYLWGHGNIGYGCGHNIAINKSFDDNATYHIILNPDIYYGNDVIGHLADFMNNHQDVGNVMPKVVYPDGRLQYLCKLLPTPYDIFSRRLLPKLWLSKRNQKYEMHSMNYDKAWNCPNLSGCFMFMRVDILKSIGLFDERFFMYFEDTDLIRRIHKVSKTVFLPDVTVVHAHASEHRVNKALLKASIKSAIQYFNKWGWLFDKERRLWNKNALSKDNLIHCCPGKFFTIK